LSSSTVSRTFTRASAQQLQALQDRDLRELDVVAVFLDGKTFADMTMVIAVRITLTGEKHVLGFVETGTENEAVLTPFLQSLCDRGLEGSKGLLVIIDGGKDLRAAVRQAFGASALVQRCQRHKRENVCVISPKGSRLTGGRGSNGPIASLLTSKPGRAWPVSSETWRREINRRPGVSPKGWRRR
jgi:transposase-like protein